MTTTKSAPAAAAEDSLGEGVLEQAAARFGIKLTAPETSGDKTGAKEGEVNEPPARDEGESDEDYSARLEEAGFDPAEVIKPEETEEERAERLQKGEDESDEDYEKRLAEEGLTLEDVKPALSEEEKKAEAEKARNDADLKKLPEAARKVAQDIINKRIGKITAQAKTKESELGGRISELETQLAEANEKAEGKPARATVVGNVPALLLDPSEDAIGKYIESVETFEDWAADHAEGYEPTEEEAAKGHQPATAAEIRARLRAVQRERDKLVPQAREALKKRGEYEAEAKKLIPALFDAKSPDYQAARTLLREQPELKRFPDYQLRVAEILLGRKALADLRTAAAKKTTTGKPAASIKKAPRLPGSGGSAKGGVAERKQGGSDAPAAVTTAIKNPTIENKRAAALAVLEG